MKRGKPVDTGADDAERFRKMVARLLRERFNGKGGKTRLGEAVGVSQSAVTQWTSAKNAPSHANAESVRELYVKSFGSDDLSGAPETETTLDPKSIRELVEDSPAFRGTAATKGASAWVRKQWPSEAGRLTENGSAPSYDELMQRLLDLKKSERFVVSPEARDRDTRTATIGKHEGPGAIVDEPKQTKRRGK